VKRPSKELRGFERIALRSGPKKIVAFTLAGEKLAFWDVKTHGFIVESGTFVYWLEAPWRTSAFRAASR
jgi:beta-glucosidase